ncbi:MAG: hypothetical protein JST87_13280 [Bacteroidetes bacterium]|nr:hypothetical protein [Bacteroidota bacterium]MBS1934352.1 hypothetical protein [Bacteroidota bacterium]
MTIDDFEFLNGIEKMQALSVFAVFLAKRKDGCYSISLFQIDNFYVEIYFHSTQLVYMSARAFTCTSELMPYLDEIDISEIYDYTRK